ncbi:hypothetical protein NFI96_000526 [Prochilodus magdalenae]|nr:hypothetical protein NFI96_000526 [Prochilodus magdalenae]
MPVWYDTTAVFGDGDVVLRTVVVTVCVHVVLRGAAVCRWCCTNRRTHGGHHCSLDGCNGVCWVSQVQRYDLSLLTSHVRNGVMSRSRRVLQEAHDEGRPCPSQLSQAKPCPIRPCYSWLLGDWTACRVEVMLLREKIST